MSIPKKTSRSSPRSTELTTSSLRAWSATTTRAALAPASRQARAEAPTPRSARDRRGDDVADDDEHDRPDHRAEVDRGRPDLGHRQDAAPEVEIRVRHVAHEREDAVEPHVVR